MGVRGLSAFLTSNYNHGVSVEMSLKEVVNEWRANNHSTGNPNVIIDGRSCIYLIYDHNHLDWICQGQWREYKENFLTFLAYIRSNGLEPVFYFDGSVPASKHDEWVERRKRDLVKIETIYSMLQQGQNPDSYPSIRKENWFIPPGLTNLTALLLKYECGVEVHESFLEGDTEITMLARELGPSRCAGILSKDTDYIIYDTKGVPFLLYDDKRSTMTKLTIFKCDQRVLATTLDISVDQLSILACLLANDTVPFNSVFTQVTLRIGSHPIYPQFIWVLMGKISELIRSYKPHMSLSPLEQMVPLGNGLLTAGVRVYREAIDGNRTDTGVHGDIIEFKRRKIAILGNNRLHEDRLSLSLEHPNLTRLLPAVHAFRTVRQRLLGLKGKKSIIEYCVYVGGAMENGEKIYALPSDVKIDQLSSATDALKWNVFCWIWSFPNNLISHLKRLQPNLQGLTILLHFIRKNMELQEWEIEAFVRQACQLYSTKGIPQYSQFSLPVPRGVHLAATFIRGLQTMVASVLACNFPVDLQTIMPWNFFDGKVFQCFYKKLSNGQALPIMDKIGQTMMDIIVY